MADPFDEPTRWSQILQGRNPDSSQYEEAWRFLFAAYREVIQRYFGRHAPDQTTAAEWADEFMADWAIGKLDGADREKGMFRQFLFGALRNFKNKKYAMARSASRKRGRLREFLTGGGGDSTAGESGRLHENLAGDEGEEAVWAFERDYANRVLQTAIKKLKRYQTERVAEGSPNHSYELIVAYHLTPTSKEDQPTYQELADRTGMTLKATERQIDYARKKLKGWILDELRETVGSEEELREEVANFLAHCEVWKAAELADTGEQGW